MKSTYRPILTLCSLLCLLVSACQDLGQRFDCQVTADCLDGQVCSVEGQCHPGDCVADIDCSAGKECHNFRCTELSSCQNDQDCDSPLPRCHLDSGACVACLSSSDCPEGADCLEQSCVPLTCQSNDQCELGQICADGDCVTGCERERDCPEGWQCLSDLGSFGTCVECQLDSDCPAGRHCEDYQCIAYCTDDAHCTPRYCDVSTNLCIDCRDDAHCAAPTPRCQSNSGTCVACLEQADCPGGYCHESFACVACLSSPDCPIGTLCLEQECVAGCFGDRDCPSGTHCDPDQAPNGVCAQCLLDEHCPAGEKCIDHSCSFSCQSDQDCEDPLPACEPISATCRQCVSEQHCQVGLTCADFTCQPGCQTVADCPAGQVCAADLGDLGLCVDCLTNTDCDTDWTCQNNQCLGEAGGTIRIAGGTFYMGSNPGEGDKDEEPERTITTQSFHIDQTEISNSQYRECVKVGPCAEPVEMNAYNDPAKTDHPVVQVTWNQAADYCAWLGKELPSEARWERAARGATPSKNIYPWGDTAPNCALSNFAACGGDTTAVGSHPQGASAEEVHDLAGNVWEWVADGYADYDPYNKDDQPAPETSTRVIRGGAFDGLAEHIRCANRASRPQTQASPNVGFRCAAIATPSAQFEITPSSAPYQDTIFQANASASADTIYSPEVLEVRWQWFSYGIKTEWTRSKTTSNRYLLPGIYNIELEVRNPDGNLDSSNQKIAAVGDWGWDGTPCTASSECAQGFICVSGGTSYDYLCREDCSPLAGSNCLTEDRICFISNGIQGEFVFRMACVDY